MDIEEQINEWVAQFSNASVWSICELKLGEQVFKEFLHVLVDLPCKMFKKPPEWLGLALTVALAECGRRDANENDFWVPVSRRFQDASWYRRVFTPFGQPTAFCRRLLEDTARHYKLRHVYGCEDTMEWYVSMRLQFGFTRQGFEKRLNEWLAGAGMPLPLRVLAGADRSVALKSDSFFRLWENLWRFRKDQITKLQLQEFLGSNPWVLPEWHDALRIKALERREYDYVYQQRVMQGDSDHWMSSLAAEEASDEGFLRCPHLVWERGAVPQFEITFETDALDLKSLTEPEYTLGFGEQNLGRILRQSDGSYRADPADIVLQNPVSPMYAKLLDGMGFAITDQHIDLWDRDAEVVVFDLTAGGLALPPVEPVLKEGVEYAVLTSPDMTVFPEAAERRTFAGRRLFRFTAQANTPTVVSFEDGYPFVELAVTERDSVNLEAVHADLISGDGAVRDGSALCARYRVRVTVPPTVILRRVRREGTTLTGTLNESSWISDSLDFKDVEHARGMRLGISLVVGDKPHSVSRTVFAPMNGITVWEAGIDQTFKRSEVQDGSLHTDKGRETRFLFRVNGDPHGYFIFEGGYCHGRIKTKPSALKNLHGFGAPLTIGYSRFHTSVMKNVSPAVFDTGILGKADMSGITLLHPLHISDGHRLVVVRPDWSVVSVSARGGGCKNLLDASLLNDGWLAVGLYFKMARLGVLWNTTDFGRCLASVADPQRVARLVTLLKQPFLHPAFKSPLRSYLLTHPAAFLETWTDPGGSDIKVDDVVFADPGLVGDDALRCSVGSLIGTGRLNLTDDVCHNIIGTFGGDANNLTEQVFAPLLDDVLDWSPRLAARLADVAIGVDRALLCKLITKVPTEDARQEVARSVDINVGFIGRLLTVNGTQDSAWANNVARLTHNRTFRRLLTCFLISNPKV